MAYLVGELAPTYRHLGVSYLKQAAKVLLSLQRIPGNQCKESLRKEMQVHSLLNQPSLQDHLMQVLQQEVLLTAHSKVLSRRLQQGSQ
jgi:hypothetical protein